MPPKPGYADFFGQWDSEMHKNWDKERKERLAKFAK